MTESERIPPLDRETLTDIVDLALTAGLLLMENGAESERVEETVRIVGTGLGCDWGGCSGLAQCHYRHAQQRR